MKCSLIWLQVPHCNLLEITPLQVECHIKDDPQLSEETIKIFLHFPNYALKRGQTLFTHFNKRRIATLQLNAELDEKQVVFYYARC